jgi:hypothetical protein
MVSLSNHRLALRYAQGECFIYYCVLYNRVLVLAFALPIKYTLTNPITCFQENE